MEMVRDTCVISSATDLLDPDLLWLIKQLSSSSVIGSMQRSWLFGAGVVWVVVVVHAMALKESVVHPSSKDWLNYSRF